ncbi:uncharacterized protein F5891DRAFT_1186621 [Suillus fuscotomentosus]|uniref:Alpha-type protein kinase domain-containing protein n=1 Tax=Suillus fuscotomentosus TaxID=1912939 RepID=A0AAD4EA33_9AGAM|nr:uncharacterized protein F5891DRAFT_1186621 [Suillus fuscotomentosus]KAG1902498.1 hypothetical protein F5891DRAFT_1186621 [Suillus fuscotomentosus]
MHLADYLQSAMSDYELLTQYTEDAYAKEDRICDRPSCMANIRTGEPCFYVATIEPGQRGRYVCESCHLHYENKRATSVRPTGNRTLQSQGRAPPDPRTIQQLVNAAQRRSTPNPPPVIAVPGGFCPRGPDIRIPTSWQGPQGSSSIRHSSQQGAIGYSSQHALYAAERDRWGKMAYASSLAETILLEITVVHEGAGARKKRGVPIGNICEGRKDVDARIDASGLIKLALETVVPKLRKFDGEFVWRVEEFIIRDAAWVDLSNHPQLVPYFYDQCLQPSRKGTKSTFKSKQFALMVVVPEAQWNEYENWLELRAEMEAEAIRTSCTQSSEHATAYTAVSFNVPSSATTSLTENELFLPSVTTNNSVTVSTKRAHQRAESSSSLSGTSSPPRKKNPPPTAFHSPDRDLLKEVLKIGGGANLNVKQVFGLHSESVQFHPIPTRDITDLLLHKQHHSFSVDTAESSIGQLTIDTSTDGFIGIGGFKTANTGWLTLTAPPKTGLGSVARHKVVVKRPFEKVFPTAMKVGAYKVGRYSLVDELQKLFREANVLYWSKSLLKLTYDFIDRSIASSPEPPPFAVPRVRFVEAGLALCHHQGGSKPGAKTGSTRAVFLLEELIEGGDDMFVKFIHNMDANPLLDELDYGYDMAEFFVFTQHVQYVKTGKLAFISDYQGSTVLLTDPQVLTHPSVSDGCDIFGEGNIEASVSKFEDQHACNEYCGWFGLETFVKEANDDEALVVEN